jgi:hypothetical protein
MRNTFLCIALLAPLLGAAEEVTVYYSATVTAVSKDPENLFGAVGVVPGNTISGSFVYESTTTNNHSFRNRLRWTYVDFSADRLPGKFAPGNIVATAEPGQDIWFINAEWEQLPKGSITFLLSDTDLGFQSSNPGAARYVGQGAMRPVIFPDPSGLTVEGGISYLALDESSRAQIGEATLDVRLGLKPFVEDQIQNIVAMATDTIHSSALSDSLVAEVEALDDVGVDDKDATIDSLLNFIYAVERQRVPGPFEDRACSLIAAADSIVVSLDGSASGSTCMTQQ